MQTTSLHAAEPAAAPATPVAAPVASPAAEILTLDDNAVRNLGIRTVRAEPLPFERTAFALGVIEARPERVGIVSSRIAGRVVSLAAYPGDSVRAGAEVARVESRLPGSPPQVIALTAPLAGTVTRLNIRLGDPVEPSVALMEISGLDELFAVARVPEHLAGRIGPGAVAKIRIPALGGEEVQGRLLRFGSLADAQSATVDAYFALANPHGRIVPGMRAEFAIVLESRAQVISVPRKAVQSRGGSRFVFVAHPDVANAFMRLAVVTGEGNERQVEILDGLAVGSEVVTDGAYSLSFAGGGGTSLKEALDAAHGHAHNEDGSEVSENAVARSRPKEKNGSSTTTAKAGDRGGEHDHSDGHSHDDGHSHSHGEGESGHSHGKTTSASGKRSERHSERDSGDNHDDHDGHDNHDGRDHSHSEDDHAHGEDAHGLLGSARLWQVTSAVLFVLLLVSLWGRKHPRDADPDSSADTDADTANAGSPASAAADTAVDAADADRKDSRHA